MKRSTRISFLVFTICAAILAFGALWYTRPGSPSYIIDEAKQRQEVPLLEVQTPATRLAPPEINYDKLASTVSPKIKESLVNDKAFINLIVDANKSVIRESVQEYTTSTLVPAMEKKISSLVSDLSSSLRSTLHEDLTTQVDEKYQTALDSIDINSYLPQLVDSLTPVVVEQVYAQIEANKDQFIQRVEVASPSVTTEDAEKLYLEYRNQIINDLVPIILDNVEASIDLDSLSKQVASTAVVSKTEEPKVEEPVVVAPATPTIKEAKPVDVALPTEVVPSVKETATTPVLEPTTKEIATTEPTPIIEDNENVALNDNSISATIVAQVPQVEPVEEYKAPVSETESIAIPSFSSRQVQTLTTEEYEERRAQIRQDAIADALKKLSE
jgi:hypothetical protein